MNKLSLLIMYFTKKTAFSLPNTIKPSENWWTIFVDCKIFSSFWNLISFIQIYDQWIKMTFQKWLKMLNETKEHPQYLQKPSHYYQIYHF